MEWLIVAGIAFAAFVGINIGGSSTGASFGPSVGASMISKTLAGVLMTGFVFVGGWTIGRNVISSITASERADERDESTQETQTPEPNECLDNLPAFGRCDRLFGLFGRVSRSGERGCGLKGSHLW